MRELHPMGTGKWLRVATLVMNVEEEEAWEPVFLPEGRSTSCFDY